PHAVTVIAVIGPQTAKTAAEFGLRVDVIAEKPSIGALVDALAAHGARLREAAIEAGEPVRKPSERRRGARRRTRSLRPAYPALPTKPRPRPPGGGLTANPPVPGPRRLRRTMPRRRLVAQVAVRPPGRGLPLFVKEDIREPQPVSS